MAASRRIHCLLALCLALVMSRTLPVTACASIVATLDTVNIADEEAVIVWDEATHMEHFIRGATFDTTAHDFGFIVPTPNTPVMAKADESAFDTLRQVLQPRVVRRPRTGYQIVWWIFGSRLRAGFSMAASQIQTTTDVDVISTQRVAGYDAVVLAADNARALTRWLRKHGYATKPSFTEWLRPYIAAHWKITAFKIAKDAHELQATSDLVRMSFHTQRPLFPYREPADQRAPRRPHVPRSLRVFMLSQARMSGTLDGTGVPAWPGQVKWANRLNQSTLSADDRDRLVHQLALAPASVTPDMWLTAFEDDSSPRPGVADLYFAPAASQATLEPPPIILPGPDERVKIPAELVALLIVGVVAGLEHYVRTGLERRAKRSRL